MKNVGTITLGCNSEKPRTVELTDMVRGTFKDHRVITVAKDEENAFLLSVENPESTGRCEKNQMYLSEGSLVGLFLTMIAFFEECNINIEELMKEYCSNEDSIQYEYNHR